jgi:hypothetical protein
MFNRDSSAGRRQDHGGETIGDAIIAARLKAAGNTAPALPGGVDAAKLMRLAQSRGITPEALLKGLAQGGNLMRVDESPVGKNIPPGEKVLGTIDGRQATRAMKRASAPPRPTETL